MRRARRFTGLVAVMALGAILAGAVRPAGAEDLLDKVVKRGVLRVGWANWDPSSYLDPNTKELRGYYPEILREVAKIMGVKIEFQEATWGTLIVGLQAGKWDIVGATRTYPRFVNAAFTQPVSSMKYAIIVKRDSPIRHLADLNKKGMKLAVMQGSNEDTEATPIFDQVEIVRVKGFGEVLMELMSGRVSAMATNNIFYSKHKDEYKDLRMLEEYFGGRSDSAFAIPRGNPEFLNYLNLVLTQMKVDGKMKGIYSKLGIADIINYEDKY